MSEYDLVVLGAGASGLIAAWEAAHRGARVAVVDHAAVVGRKVRISGGGKGNVTNRIMGPEWFVGDQPGFCTSVLQHCGTARVLSILEQLHIPIEEREDGQLFCQTSAAQLVGALHNAGVQCGVTYLLRYTIAGVEDMDTGGVAEEGVHAAFRVHLCSPDGVATALTARTVLIALGGPAWQQVGASDFGQRLAKQWGHRAVPTRPVLVPLVMPQDWPLHGLAGISLMVRVQTASLGSLGSLASLASPGKASKGVNAEGASTGAFTRSLLFTHKGVSGPAILHVSCVWRSGQPLVIDFLPGQDLRELMHDPEHGKLMVRTLLGRGMPDRLVDRLLCGELAECSRRKVAELGKAARAALHAAVHAHTVTPLRTEGLAKAEASAGGVATADVDPRTLMSRLRPGLYFAGEVLDVTGLLGGYNLHWAWASGLTVGQVVSHPPRAAGILCRKAK